MMPQTDAPEREPRVDGLPALRPRPPRHQCRDARDRRLRASLRCAGLTMLILAGNASGQPFIDIGVGSSHVCALDPGGAVACSLVAGTTRFDAPPGIGPFVEISAGEAHSCGLDPDGAVTCWGDNDFGQLDVPLTERTVVQLDAGDNHTCALTEALTAFCWGEGSAGQTRVPDDAGGDLIAISAGYLHSCALRSSGQALCWGAGSDEFSQADETVVPPESGPFTAIDAGHDLSCGLTSSGEIQCWGANPGVMEGAFTDLATNYSGVCGLRASGLVDCVPDFRGVTTVNQDFPLIGIESAVGSGGCGINVNGAVFCWGDQLGRLPSPGSIKTGTVAVPFDLRVSVYSESLIELLWQNRDNSFERRGFEIFRNDERLALTTNGNSYLDTDVAPGTQYTYRVRAVSFRGEIGEFSASVTVSTAEPGSVGVAPPSPPPYAEPPRLLEPVALNASVIPGDGSVELRWELQPSMSVFGFEVRRDGNFIGFTTDDTFLDRSTRPGRRYHYDVIAVDEDGTIQGFRGIDVLVDSAP